MHTQVRDAIDEFTERCTRCPRRVRDEPGHVLIGAELPTAVGGA
jgi:hypothetical protein